MQSFLRYMGKGVVMTIRKIKEITAEEENFRVKQIAAGIGVIRRDPIAPVPVGTLIVKVFRVMGYNKDCDCSLMARLENVDNEGRSTGWTQNCIGLYPDATWQIDSPDDIDKLTE